MKEYDILSVIINWHIKLMGGIIMKRLIIILITIIAITSMILLCIFINKKDQTLFYASSEQQDLIYDRIMSSEELKAELEAGSLTVIKESIAPMYGIDLAEYSKNGELKAEHKPTVVGDDWIYMAKVITEKGDFAANLRLYIGDDSFSYSFIESYAYAVAENISDDYWYLESWSYADHAEEIKNILGSDKIIPASDVKYTTTAIGDFFFIDNEQYKVLIPIGIYTARGSREMSFGYTAGPVLDVQRLDEGGQQLKEIADYYRDWTSEESGDSNMPDEYITRECTLVNNIIDINGYLGIDAGKGRLFFSVNTATLPWITLAIMCVSALAFVIIRQIVLKKRSRSK